MQLVELRSGPHYFGATRILFTSGSDLFEKTRSAVHNCAQKAISTLGAGGQAPSTRYGRFTGVQTMFSQHPSHTPELFSIPANCRAWVRLPCNLQALVEDEDSEPEHARIVNISLGGIGLMCPDAIPLGTILRVELSRTAHQSHRVFVVRVMQSGMEKQGGWLVGCEFVKPLTNKRSQELLYRDKQRAL
jgi:hypothetical protein